MSRSRLTVWTRVALLPVVVVVAVVAGHSAHGNGPSPTPSPAAGPLGAEGVPVPDGTALARPGAPGPGGQVDGISSTPSEQSVVHIHAHLTVFVDGKARQIPGGIGIAAPRQVQPTPRGPFIAGGARFSWLHTHAPDGIVHIESPVRRTFTLGELFDVWGQPLGPKRVGPAFGRVTAFFDGRHYPGSPRDIPLTAHAQIQLDVGRPQVAASSIAFPAGL